MATPRWEGGASKVKQVVTYAFAGTWEADDVNRIQVGNKIKDTTTSSTVIATLLGTLVTAINALSTTDFPEITSTESGIIASTATTILTLTANTAGVPFTATMTPLEVNLGAADLQTIEGAGIATTGTVATANAGPKVYGTAANWDTGLKPVATDTVHFDNSDDDILYDLSQAGATLTAGHIWQSFEGTIGLSKSNTMSEEYPEYRTEYLTIDCTTWHIGAGPGNGSGRIKINSGSVQTTVNVYNTGFAKDAGLESLLWKGTHISNVMSCYGEASVGIARFGGETATLATLNVDGNAKVVCGDGTTLTTINVNRGELEVNSNIGGTLTQLGGRVTVNKTATAAQLTLRGGQTIYNSTGTISGNTILSGDAVLDFSKAPGAVTVTNPIELYGDRCRILDPNKRVVSLVVDFNEGAGQSQVEWGVNVRLTRATPA